MARSFTLYSSPWLVGARFLLLNILGTQLTRGEESKWPPLSEPLVERIVNLPKERKVVADQAREITGSSKSEFGDGHVITHWEPVLIGRAENITREDAEKRYDELLDTLNIFTQAELESEYGIITAAGAEYSRPAKTVTEHLLAYYVRRVMVPDVWGLDEYIDWCGRLSGDPAYPDTEDEKELRDSLNGHWAADPEMGMFGYAAITPWRVLLVWEESDYSAARSYSFVIHRINEERIYSAPDDVG